MAGINLTELTKRYGKHTVLHGLDLDIRDGEFIALVGPSGCGKSTTLRMIAGLEDITEGELRIGERVVNDEMPRDRNIAMVFQNYAIYPHLTVAQNISFGLYASKLSKPEKLKRVEAAASMLGLDDLLKRRPSQLSGGQRQRVAIGRAMVREPEVFLFDEPLSNLDAQLRGQMRIEIKRLHRQLGTTIVYVTHDQIEAMTMADRIAIMRDGYILQVGTPLELFENPVDVFTARFIGTPSINMVAGSAVVANGQASVELGPLGRHAVAGLSGFSETPRAVQIGMRPQDIAVDDKMKESISFTGSVVEVEPLGSEALVHAEVGGTPLIARHSGRLLPAIGSQVVLSINPEQLYYFDAETEKSLGRPALAQ